MSQPQSLCLVASVSVSRSLNPCVLSHSLCVSQSQLLCLVAKFSCYVSLHPHTALLSFSALLSATQLRSLQHRDPCSIASQLFLFVILRLRILISFDLDWYSKNDLNDICVFKSLPWNPLWEREGNLEVNSTVGRGVDRHVTNVDKFILNFSNSILT